MSNNENKNLIYIPKDANYIEILGHRIDGFDSFENFCEHLNKYTELEETVKHLQAENSKLKKSNRNWRRKVQRLRNTVEDLEDRLSGLLCEVTGSRMSKAYYPLQTMIYQAHDYQQECCEYCEYYKENNNAK